MSDTPLSNSELLDLLEKLSMQQIAAKDALRTLVQRADQEMIRKACSLPQVDRKLEAVKEELKDRGCDF